MNIMELYQPKHCKECGAMISDGSRVMLCINCNNKLRARLRRMERNAAGLCANCGGVLDDGRFKECSGCRERRRIYNRQEREQQRLLSEGGADHE